MSFSVQFSKRLQALPPYLFVELEQAKQKAMAEGRDIIDLGVGDPDLPTPTPIIEALYKAAQDPANQRYALDQGLPELRRAIQRWYERRFGVELDPDTDILPLIGSKEGIAHLPLGLINPGDKVLVPDPCYPPYRGGTLFAGGEVVPLPLLEKRQFLPDFSTLKASQLKKTKLLFLNYPNNPTGAVAERKFFEGALDFCRRHSIMIAHDAAYTEVAFDGYKPSSFLQAKGAKELGVEFHSLSKTFNMTGWRIGFAVGKREIVAALAKVKANVDSGIFQAIQIAGVYALEHGGEWLERINQTYVERRNLLVQGLKKLGFRVPDVKATFYLWIAVPTKEDSTSFARRLLEGADVVVTPGVGFGKSGEGYFRMTLTVPKERMEEACARIRKVVG